MSESSVRLLAVLILLPAILIVAVAVALAGLTSRAQNLSQVGLRTTVTRG